MAKAKHIEEEKSLVKKYKDMKPEEKKVVSTAFLLMFPALIVAAIAAFYAPVMISFVAIALCLYQFIMIARFIKDYYSTH